MVERPIRLAAGKSVIVELVEKGKKEPLPIVRASVGIREIAEAVVATPRQVLITAKEEGTTGLILWAEDGRHRMVDVEVIAPVTDDLAKDLNEEIRREFPGTRVQARFVRDTIVLTGTAPTAEVAGQIVDLAGAFLSRTGLSKGGGSGTAEAGQQAAGSSESGSAGGKAGDKSTESKIKNHIKIAGEHQVLLRCTVAEVSKKAVRQLGINGWLAGDNVRDVFAVNQINGINPVNIGAAGGQNIIQPGGLVFTTDKDGLNLAQATTLSIGFPRVQMQMFFQALRENDLLRVLAEPDLVAVAGQEAKFLVGGEFPVPVPQSAGTGGVTITIEWKRFGIQLVFVATPISRDMIRLRVAPVVSDLDFTAAVQLQGFLVPGIRERRAETTIELANGSTIAIAGLLSDSSRGVARKVPAVGDIPVLGALFSSVQYQRDQTELVILVTPELAAAMNPDQVAPVPGQYMTEPNDWQLFGLGLLEGEPEPDPDEPELAVKTDVPVRNRKWTAPPTQMSLHGPWGVADEAETR
ncbi:MAG: type II and III secretion system protein family protein [Phycisphaerae bacterium]